MSNLKDKQEKKWQEIADRLKVFYMQIDETYEFPNSREGDLLKMVHKAISAPQQNNETTLEKILDIVEEIKYKTDRL